MDLTKVIERAKQGDKEAKEIIIERYKPLTYKMSAEFFIRGYDREDLIQIGYISILKAIEQFDLSKGQNFTSYVQYSLRNNFYSMVRDKYKEKYDPSLNELVEGTNLELEETLASDFNLEEDILEKEELEALKQAMKILNEEEKQVIYKSFNASYGGLKAYAEEKGITYNKAATIKRAALTKLKKQMNK